MKVIFFFGWKVITHICRARLSGRFAHIKIGETDICWYNYIIFCDYNSKYWRS